MKESNWSYVITLCKWCIGYDKESDDWYNESSTALLDSTYIAIMVRTSVGMNVIGE